jgi:exopolysaccharide biosynthesis WecB/TagA/CpsF family protein
MLEYVNAHTLNIAIHDNRLHDALARSDFVLNDGLGLSLAARMRHDRFPENLSGSDFTMQLPRLAAERGWRVFLLGGRPGVAEVAKLRLTEQIADLQIVGTCDGFTGESDELLASCVRESDATLLVVALGSPAQEVWLSANLGSTGALIGVAVGAFLDFSAGRVRRVLHWMNVLGIEWYFRLAQEPARLWRRYLIGNPLCPCSCVARPTRREPVAR